jgi:hypothetical protein
MAKTFAQQFRGVVFSRNKGGNIISRLGSRLRGYFIPEVGVTYARAAKALNTGTQATSVYFSCPHNAAIAVSGAGAKFTVSTWYQPVSFSGSGEILVAKGSLASGNGFAALLVAQGDGTYKMRVLIDLAWAIITPVIRGTGHFMIVVDTSLGASWAGQIKVYQNGTLIDPRNVH